MFGSDLASKLEAIKATAEASKERLDNLVVEGEAGNGLVIVTLTGNRSFKSIQINTDHKLMEKDDLEDLISVAFDRALSKANDINEKEVMNSTQGLFPGF